jgi:hypothetical protein
VKKNETRRTPVVVTETEVLDEGFTAEQERVLRMRTGASLGAGALLGSKLDGIQASAAAQVRAKLLLIEAQFLERVAASEPDAEAGAPLADASRKASIVAALRNKPRA